MVDGLQAKREKRYPPRFAPLYLQYLDLLELTQKAAPILEPPSRIFGVELQNSIKYANVAISLTNEEGKSFIYGYVPIVVAKCGVFLKEKGEITNRRCDLPSVLTSSSN